MWEPCGDSGGPDERREAECEEADAPTDVVGEDTGGDAADEAAESGAADIEAHDEGDTFRRPFFADVGDDYGDDPGNHDALKEPPEDELGEGGGGGREKRGDGDAEDGVDDDALAGEAFGERSEDGSRDGNAQGCGGDGHADAGFGGVEDAGEQGEERLGAVELKEGADTAECNGGGGLAAGMNLVGLRL